MNSTTCQRCAWATTDEMIAYHDHEWGVPNFANRHLFEMLILEGAQAGLSWQTILKKRENYRRAFDDFDVEKIARYDDAKVAALLADAGIVRNKLKIAATIQNAKATLSLQKSGVTLSDFLWQFVDGKPKENARKAMSEIPARTAESDAMSKALLAHGFKFVGSTICYSLMQAVGMVNDHLVTCPRHAEIVALASKKSR